MAPKKEKVEKASVGAQEDMVFEYLRMQNRPYSATDVSANLHNKVTKSAAQKILIKLHEAKKIEGRISGKQSDPEDAPTPEQLVDMDARTQALRDETITLNAQAKSLRLELAQLNSSLSTADLRAQVAAMQVEKRDVESRLVNLRNGQATPVSVEEKKFVDMELRKMEKCAAARRAIVKEMWSVIADVTPREEWADLKENLGIDT